MKTSMNSRSREEGFALLAVLVILVILALLASSVALTTERAVADMQGRIDDESFRRDAFSTQETLAYLLVTQRVTIAGLTVDDQVAKVSLVGAGMRSHPGVSATFFKTLADASVNVEMISTSEIRISVVTRVDDAKKAVAALHTAFGLDADGEAVVYAGTGR